MKCGLGRSTLSNTIPVWYEQFCKHLLALRGCDRGFSSNEREIRYTRVNTYQMALYEAGVISAAGATRFGEVIHNALHASFEEPLVRKGLA